MATSLNDFSYRLVHGNIHITGYYGDDTALRISETYVINGTERDVTAIEESAFESNKNITSVILPATIESIGDYAFYDCTALKEVTLLCKNAAIGKQAFGYYYISRKKDDKVAEFTLIAYEGGTATDYILEHGFSFIKQTRPVGRGDIDANGEYTAADLAVFRKYILNAVSLNTDQLEAADLNADGAINILDLVKLKKKLIS